MHLRASRIACSRCLRAVAGEMPSSSRRLSCVWRPAASPRRDLCFARRQDGARAVHDRRPATPREYSTRCCSSTSWTARSCSENSPSRAAQDDARDACVGAPRPDLELIARMPAAPGTRGRSRAGGARPDSPSPTAAAARRAGPHLNAPSGMSRSGPSSRASSMPPGSTALGLGDVRELESVGPSGILKYWTQSAAMTSPRERRTAGGGTAGRAQMRAGRHRQEREDAARSAPEIDAIGRSSRCRRLGQQDRTAPKVALPNRPAARDGGGHDEQDNLATSAASLGWRSPRRPGPRNGVERGHGIGRAGGPPREQLGEQLDVLPSPASTTWSCSTPALAGRCRETRSTTHVSFLTFDASDTLATGSLIRADAPGPLTLTHTGLSHLMQHGTRSTHSRSGGQRQAQTSSARSHNPMPARGNEKTGRNHSAPMLPNPSGILAIPVCPVHPRSVGAKPGDVGGMHCRIDPRATADRQAPPRPENRHVTDATEERRHSCGRGGFAGPQPRCLRRHHLRASKRRPSGRTVGTWCWRNRSPKRCPDTGAAT